MKDEIEKIRALLHEIEAKSDQGEPSFRETYQLFELPELIASIIDYLQPALLPYEAAIYWYMFRHSIIATGDVFVRVSTRGMQGNVVTSMRSNQSNELALGTVRESLAGLVRKGAISIAGDVSSEGTPYHLHLPEEIDVCREAMSRKELERPAVVDPKKELDFYNVRVNRLKIFERDKYLCHHCGKLLTRFSATLDHLQPVSEGGDNSYGNLITACLHCNSQRGSQPLMDFLSRNRDAQL